jgi:hypothetical protein
VTSTSSTTPALRALLAFVVAWFASSCAAWTPVHRDATWTLYVKDGESVDVDRFGRALAPAFEAVESRMGRFSRRVRVHAWDGETIDGVSGQGPFEAGPRGEVHEVPGIGPARVRAFHVKGGSMLFHQSGVFLGVADVGTAVHELVHARVAETGLDLPLWFEEGIASYWGDGAFHDGRWVVDGLACWPLRELRDQRLSDSDLRRLLALHARDDYDARENLLVHFLGWALVFDLAREAPEADWLEWKRTFEADSERLGPEQAARARLERVLADSTQTAWFEHLASEAPGRRFAAAKGLWKLRDTGAIDALLGALEREQDPELRVALALNVLLASGETRVGRTRWNRLATLVFPTLRETELPDERENKALRDVYASLRRWESRRNRTTQDALEDLARFWEE